MLTPISLFVWDEIKKKKKEKDKKKLTCYGDAVKKKRIHQVEDYVCMCVYEKGTTCGCVYDNQLSGKIDIYKNLTCIYTLI